MKQTQRLILKIESKELKKNKWNLKIDFDTAKNENYVVGISESQAIRWIDELRGRGNVGAKIRECKKEIAAIKKTSTSKTKTRLKNATQKMNELKYVADLVCVVFPPCTIDKTSGEMKNPQFDRANKGFYINGIKYVRFLGTPGGIKKCSILYISEDIHAEIMRRVDNGRAKNKEIIPAKLEAYQALICSGSIPLPMPKGFIVVKDCITKFKEDVIVIRDGENGNEPIITNEKDYEIEHNGSDGFGLMLPSYAAKLNEYINNDPTPLSGAVIRYAWTKGLLVSFDFVEFAEKIANNYIITDVWGQKRDIRDAEIILTESMLKLWDSYSSWEEYENNCIANGYLFSATKTAPTKLEDVRTSNYQFLNPYSFNDEEIKQLCAPTLDEIKNIMRLNPNYTMLYLTGEKFQNYEDWQKVDNAIVKALQYEPELINDPYIRAHVWHNIKMKIERAKLGKINLDGNFAIISGDPYALLQSMWEMNVTGLLSAGEVYHKYWIDKGANEIACFRAPMTNINNIRKLNITQSESAVHWYQYIDTICVLNAWDSTFEAENGADADGDTFYCTDNQIILSHTENLPTIISIQTKAGKTIPTEEKIIESNKRGFSDEIGEITNRATAMIDLRTSFPPESEEYKILTYRILCSQHFQQSAIDKIKGAQTQSMPEYWYSLRGNDDELNARIAATKKPYFMIYRYPKLGKERKKLFDYLVTNAPKKCECEYFQLAQSNHPDAAKLLEQFNQKTPVTDYNCVVNRIAHYFEDEINDFQQNAPTGKDYDYSILKSGAEYTKTTYNKIKKLFEDYQTKASDFMFKAFAEHIDKDDCLEDKQIVLDYFAQRCAVECPDEKVLTDILLDITYAEKKSKCGLVWEICGNVICENVFAKTNKIIIPVRNETNKEFEYNGHGYHVERIEIE